MINHEEQTAQGEPRDYCTYRCLLDDGHDGTHFCGYNLPSDKDIIAKLQGRIDAAIKLCTLPADQFGVRRKLEYEQRVTRIGEILKGEA